MVGIKQFGDEKKREQNKDKETRKEKRNMKKMMMTICLFICLVLCMGQSGCDQRQQESTSGAKQTVATKIPLNSRGKTVEQQNIDDRIHVTTDPAKVMWIHLVALDGKILRRMPVRCKVTSSGKRLEPTNAADGTGSFPNSPFRNPDSSNYYWETNEFIQPDGTYGESDAYIFWFDPQGRYHQWGTAGGLGYLLTDYPIDLSDPIDELNGMYKMHQAAYEWQKQQEKLLEERETELSGKGE